MIGAGGVSPDGPDGSADLRAVLERLIKAKYDESPVDRYPQEGPLAAALIEGLAAAGFAVVQLPKPDEDGEWYEDTWYVNADPDMPNPQKLRVNVPQMHMAAGAASRFAAALLAASLAVGGLPVGEENSQP